MTKEITCTPLALFHKCPEINGAGEGNRTLVWTYSSAIAPFSALRNGAAAHGRPPQDLAFRELYIRIMLRYVTLPIGDVFRTDVAPCFERCVPFFTLPMVEAAKAMIEGMFVFRAR